VSQSICEDFCGRLQRLPHSCPKCCNSTSAAGGSKAKEFRPKTISNVFIQLRDDPESALDLIFNEFLIRERLVNGRNDRDLLIAFPLVARVLEAQIALLLEAKEERQLLRMRQQLGKLDLLVLGRTGLVPASKAGAELLFRRDRHRLRAE